MTMGWHKLSKMVVLIGIAGIAEYKTQLRIIRIR